MEIGIEHRISEAIDKMEKGRSLSNERKSEN